MSIVKVSFHDWNGNDKEVEVTSNMCEGLALAKNEETLFVTAIQYIKRRYTECISINSVEIIAN